MGSRDSAQSLSTCMLKSPSNITEGDKTEETVHVIHRKKKLIMI